jgi:hypothetical protein
MISVSVKFLHDEPLHMNLNEKCDIDAYLIESCPAVVQALYLLPLEFTLGANHTEMTCTYLILDFFLYLNHERNFSQTSAKNGRKELLRE